MDALDKNVVRIRMRQLNSSQNSIQTLSMWLSHHHKDAELTADAWLEELSTNKATSDWYKAMFYLANDVVQNCRKDKKHVVDAYYTPFFMAVDKLGRRQIHSWEKVIASVYRVIDILKERNVYEAEKILDLKKAINWRPADGTQMPTTSQSSSASSTPSKGDRPGKGEHTFKGPNLSVDQKQNMRKRAFGEVETALAKLVAPPSMDSAIRQKIATYPETIADTRKTAIPDTLKEAEEVYEKAKEAQPLVKEYAQRVKGELTNIREAQKKMTGMADFMKLELQRDKDILEKAKTYIDALYRKKSRIDKLKQASNPQKKPVGTLPDLDV